METKTTIQSKEYTSMPPIWVYFSKWLGLLLCLAVFGALRSQLYGQSTLSFSHGGDRQLAHGDTLTIPLITENMNDLQSIQFNLHFNPHLLSFVELNSLDTSSGIFPENIGLSEAEEGRIFFVALATTTPINLDNGDTLCQLVFTATGTPHSSSLFGVQGYPLELQAFNGSEFVPFAPSAIQISISTPKEAGFTYSVCNNRDSSDVYDLKINFFGDSVPYLLEVVQSPAEDTIISTQVFPDSSHILSNLPPASYLLILRSPSDSTLLVDSVEITSKNDLDPLLVIEDASCPQIPNGSIGLPFIQGANSPYTVLWPDSTLHFRNYEDLLPRFYRLKIIDEDHCEFNIDVEVGGPEAIVQETITAASCETAEDASLRVDVINLDRFEDSTLLFSLTGSDWFRTTALQIVSLPTGPFTYFIQDTAGCIYTQNVIIPFDNTIQLENVNQVDPRCFGTNDGLVSATARLDIVRSGEFVFEWSGPNPSVTDSFFLAVGLRPDTFTLRVTHTALPASCFDTETVILEDTDSLEFDFTLEEETCFGQSDGFISVTPRGGTPPYSYNWADGARDSLRENLAPGQYEIELEDANLCSQTTSFKIDTGLLLSLTDITLRDIDCFGNGNGTIDFILDTQYRANQTLAYFLSPLGADTTQLDSLAASVENLSGGNYSLSIFSNSGCKIDTVLTLEEPDPILLDTFSTQMGDCDIANASIEISPFGGNGGPFQYLWSTGDTTQTLDSVLNGAYAVSISDQVGCMDSFSFFLTSPSPPVIDTFFVEEPSCFGDSTARVRLIYNTENRYTFDWSTGDTTAEIGPILAGNYQVIVRTERNCKDTISIPVSQPDSISISFTTEPETAGLSDGRATAKVSGGTAPYQYFWNTTPIQTDSTAVSIPAGTYEVLIIDANNCRASDTVRVDMLTTAEESFGGSDLILWPNPNSGRFFIQQTSSAGKLPIEIKLYDYLGREQFTLKWPNGQEKISISQPGSGLYYIHVLYQNSSRKMIPVIIQQ